MSSSTLKRLFSRPAGKAVGHAFKPSTGIDKKEEERSGEEKKGSRIAKKLKMKKKEEMC